MDDLYHKAVLLKESIDGVVWEKDGIYLDLTFGGGGHSKALLEQLGPKAKVIALDQDKKALERKIADDRLYLFHQNFKYIGALLKSQEIHQVSGILADLGVSSHQIDTPERGFSTRFNHLLDMRMNQVEGKESALDIINTYSHKKLTEIFMTYGELPKSHDIAQKICKEREKKKIETTFDLIQLFEKEISPYKKQKHFAKLFQALRIEVNDEIAILKRLLLESPNYLKPKGRIAIISYHSLEDRLVKRFFKFGNFHKEPQKDFYGNVIGAPLEALFIKAIKASENEIKLNSRARSARLRIAQKKPLA